MSGTYEVPSSDRDITVAAMASEPAVDRIVQSILNEDSLYGPRRTEDVAMDAAIQNFKLWCDGF
jgi:hypothetical protein